MNRAQELLAARNLRVNKAWTEQYIGLVVQTLAPFLIKEAPVELDCRDAVDLVVYSPRITVRLRRPGYALRYPHQFTLRLRATEKTPYCEWDKIVDGRVDWLFYGHLDENSAISHWLLVDLRRLLEAFIRGEAPYSDHDNPDTGRFRAFDASLLPPDCLIAVHPAMPWGGAA